MKFLIGNALSPALSTLLQQRSLAQDVGRELDLVLIRAISHRGPICSTIQPFQFVR